MPKIPSRLNRFDPTMLPTAISGFPFIEAIKLVIISGADVPAATIVRPIIKGETFSFLAKPIAPLTSRSPPNTRIVKPSKSNNRLKVRLIIRNLT